ncbi:2Fe-2S iron-sulfur cluster-binding protein [Streptomyces sp. TRM 70361]|uniref:2Fe-2S iron-sulfur cluster-binding protein n=1 Tax=Streptomyces sp. TRM 70361 TaxID=3116553 RepID=UPI002E7B3D66|nr:2Fe-2S iron-sulfur cluster-binding protein [Streptomyces sp. TRM 70361]MEE1939486.1 2Fe-2S iron-sulfur cluster-binding protein [Streptomyces sp. TRM 70361]
MRFHPLRVRAVEPVAEDAVAVTFEVPPGLYEVFRHTPGQHVTLRRTADGAGGTGGAEVRRTYSVCAPAVPPPAAPVLRIGVRLVAGGAFSAYAVKELAAGDTVEVSPPTGRFTLRPRPGRFAAVTGGSGITPVLSMAATLLAERPDARFHLVRCDRTAASAMFLDEAAELKDRHPDRFQLVHLLSREERRTGPPAGRPDAGRLAALLPALLPVADVSGWFLCGPLGLVRAAERALAALGVPATAVHQEIFHVDEPTDGTDARQAAPAHDAPGGTELTAVLGGRRGSWTAGAGETLLETVLRHRPDAPYACRGGVCGTCRARLVSGEVRMDRHFALEPEEVSAGYVLACQSHPVTGAVEVDFDS